MLSLDATRFKQALTNATADVGTAGSQMGKTLHRSFGAQNIAKGILMGIGLGSVEKAVDHIARLWTGMTDDLEKSYKKIADSSDASTERTIDNMRKMASEEVKYQLLLKERAKLTDRPGESFQAQGPGLLESMARAAGAFPQNPLSLALAEYADRLAAVRKEENEVGLFNAREDDKAKAERVASEIAEADKKRAEAWIKLSEDRDSKEKNLNETLQENSRKEMDLEGEIADLKAEQLRLSDEVITDYDKWLERAIEIAKVEGRITDLKKKQADEAEKAAQKHMDLMDKLESAKAAVADARAGYATNLRDRSGSTLAEVASGAVGSQTSKAAARDIMRLESRAKRIRGMKEYRDASGNLVDSGMVADEMINKADAFREGLGMLTSAEKNPMAAAATSLKNSETHLKEIRDELKSEKIK